MFDRAKLADLADLAMGETILADDCDGKGFPIYSAATEDGPWNHSSRITRKLSRGTIVVGARGSIGFPRMPTAEKFGATQTTITVKSHDGLVDPRFLFHALRSLDFKALTSQQAIPMLTVAEFGAVSLPRPPLNEQAEIVVVLDTLDTTIRQTDAIIAKLKQVKQGLLHDLLTRGIDANGELRPPQSEAQHLYKASPLGWIPVEWRVQPISALVRYVTYGFTNPMPTTTDGPWMLTAADIGDGQVDYTKARRTNPSDFSRLSPKSRPSIGDILITKDGTLGRVAVLDKGGVCVNQSVAVLPPSDPAQGAFLALYLRSPTGQDRMLADAGGSTIKHLYITTLASMLVPSPEPGEAALIGERVSAAEARISQEMDALNKLFKLKSGLMDDLLTGRVRVTPLLQDRGQSSPEGTT